MRSGAGRRPCAVGCHLETSRLIVARPVARCTAPSSRRPHPWGGLPTAFRGRPDVSDFPGRRRARYERPGDRPILTAPRPRAVLIATPRGPDPAAWVITDVGPPTEEPMQRSSGPLVGRPHGRARARGLLARRAPARQSLEAGLPHPPRCSVRSAGESTRKPPPLPSITIRPARSSAAYPAGRAASLRTPRRARGSGPPHPR